MHCPVVSVCGLRMYALLHIHRFSITTFICHVHSGFPLNVHITCLFTCSPSNVTIVNESNPIAIKLGVYWLWLVELCNCQ